jgi:hypothetical protein
VSGRVRIGTCANPADAAFIRSMFAARGIDIVIGAEHHASLLGPIGGGFLSLDIWVASDDAEEAVALLRDLREAGPGDGDAETAGDAGPEEAVPGVPDDALGEDDDFGHELKARTDRRRRTGLAILLGCCITFGTAHLVTRAWLRGLALAVTEIVGIRYLALGDRRGSLLVIGAVLADVIGALWRLRAPPALPAARVRRS